MIYAIEAVGLSMVKIGKAKHPKRRLAALRTGCPVPMRLVAEVNWDDSVEVLIHRAFAKWRRDGEWFEAEGAMLMNAGRAERWPRG